MTTVKSLKNKTGHQINSDRDSGYEDLSQSGRTDSSLEDIIKARLPSSLADWSSPTRMPEQREISTKMSIVEEMRKREIEAGKIGIVHMLIQRDPTIPEKKLPNLKPILKSNELLINNSTEFQVTSRKPRRKRRSKSADGKPVRQISMFNPLYTKILSPGEIKERNKWTEKLRMDALLDEEYYKLPYEEINKEIALDRYSRSEPRLNWKRKERKKVSFSSDIMQREENRNETINTDNGWNWKEDSGFHEMDIFVPKSIVRESYTNESNFHDSNVFLDEEILSDSIDSDSSNESQPSQLNTTEISELESLYHLVKEQEIHLADDSITSEAINLKAQTQYIKDLIMNSKAAPHIPKVKIRKGICSAFKTNVNTYETVNTQHTGQFSRDTVVDTPNSNDMSQLIVDIPSFINSEHMKKRNDQSSQDTNAISIKDDSIANNILEDKNEENDKIEKTVSPESKEEIRKRFYEMVPKPLKIFSPLQGKTDLYDRYHPTSSEHSEKKLISQEKTRYLIKNEPIVGGRIKTPRTLSISPMTTNFDVTTDKILVSIKSPKANNVDEMSEIQSKYQKTIHTDEIIKVSTKYKNNNIDEFCNPPLINTNVITLRSPKTIKVVPDEKLDSSKNMSPPQKLITVIPTYGKTIKTSSENCYFDDEDASSSSTKIVSSDELNILTLQEFNGIHEELMSTEILENDHTTNDDIYNKKKGVLRETSDIKEETKKRFFEQSPAIIEKYSLSHHQTDSCDMHKNSSSSQSKEKCSYPVQKAKVTMKNVDEPVKIQYTTKSTNDNTVELMTSGPKNSHKTNKIDESIKLPQCPPKANNVNPPIFPQTNEEKRKLYALQNKSNKNDEHVKYFSEIKTDKGILHKHQFIDLIGKEKLKFLYPSEFTEEISLKHSNDDQSAIEQSAIFQLKNIANDVNQYKQTTTNDSIIYNENIINYNLEDTERNHSLSCTKELEGTKLNNNEDTNNNFDSSNPEIIKNESILEEEFLSETDHNDENIVTDTTESTENESEEDISESSSESIATYNSEKETHEVSIKDSPDKTKCAVNEHHEYHKEEHQSATAADKEKSTMKSIVRRKVEETITDVVNVTSVVYPRKKSLTNPEMGLEETKCPILETDSKSTVQATDTNLNVDIINLAVSPVLSNTPFRSHQLTEHDCTYDNDITSSSPKTPPIVLPRKSLYTEKLNGKPPKASKRSHHINEIEGNKNSFQKIKLQQVNRNTIDNMAKIKEAFIKAGLNPKVFDELSNFEKQGTISPSHFRENFVNMLMTKELDFTDYNIHLRTRKNSRAPNFTVTRKYLPLSIINEKMSRFRETPAEKSVYTCQISSSNENIHKAALNLLKVPSSCVIYPEGRYEYNDRDESPIENKMTSPTPSWTESSSSGCFSASCSPTPLPTTGKPVPIPTAL